MIFDSSNGLDSWDGITTYAALSATVAPSRDGSIDSGGIIRHSITYCMVLIRY